MANRYSQIVKTAREAFSRNISRDVKFRKQQLNQLYNMLSENENLFVDALREDFRKPRYETVLTEIDFVKNDIKSQLHSIDEYVRPLKVGKNMLAAMDDAFIHYEPYGVVLVIGAWNYPVQLSLGPLIGAITAGNCAVLKPSEISPNTANVLSKLIPQYLNRDCYHVVTGGPKETSELLENKFDYIFFTGSTHIGKMVHQAAAKHMTPVTLELGGKSPLYIDETVPNFETAWRRVLWAKLLNAGQTCVAPDYVLCTEKVQETLVKHAEKIIKEFYGTNPKESADFPRIVNDRHWERLNGLMKKSGKPLVGGDSDASQRYISPTILTGVSTSDPIMQEEIFGPVLPIVVIKDIQDAIDLINKGEKPLSLYLFTNKSKVINRFLNETSSGSVCANDAVIHLSVETLPFGGVGASGMGAYHGRSSFETFSHGKSVLVRNYNPVLELIGSARYPPYTEGKLNFMRNLIKKRKLPIPIPSGLGYVLTFAMGIGAILAYQYVMSEVLNF